MLRCVEIIVIAIFWQAQTQFTWTVITPIPDAAVGGERVAGLLTGGDGNDVGYTGGIN